MEGNDLSQYWPFYQNCIKLTKQKYVRCSDSAANKYNIAVVVATKKYNDRVNEITNKYANDLKICDERFSFCVVDVVEKRFIETTPSESPQSAPQVDIEEIEEVEIIVQKKCVQLRKECVQDAINKQANSLQDAVRVLQEDLTKASENLKKDKQSCSTQVREQEKLCNTIHNTGGGDPAIIPPPPSGGGGDSGSGTVGNQGVGIATGGSTRHRN